MKRRGILITLEGIDGSGKSTHVRRLVQYLCQRGFRATATREPGSTRVGEQVRDILLASRNRELTPLAELALFYAARAQHLAQVVRPALERGEIVVSDRFNDSSRAYQGFGHGLGLATVEAFDRAICGDVQPSLTLLLDVDPAASLGRAVRRETRQKSRHSRFEQAGLDLQRRARAGYLELARREPQRIKVVPADRPPRDVQQHLRRIVEEFLKSRRRAR